jgi:hypothetical protein
LKTLDSGQTRRRFGQYADVMIDLLSTSGNWCKTVHPVLKELDLNSDVNDETDIERWFAPVISFVDLENCVALLKLIDFNIFPDGSPRPST